MRQVPHQGLRVSPGCKPPRLGPSQGCSENGHPGKFKNTAWAGWVHPLLRPALLQAPRREKGGEGSAQAL